MTDLGVPTFFCAAQNPPGDFPTENRSIRQVIATRLQCTDETDPQFWFTHDTVVLVYVVYSKRADGTWNIESRVTRPYELEDGDTKQLAPTDAVLFQSPAGQESRGQVEIHVQAFEDDTNDFTWQDAIQVSHAIAQEVIGEWLRQAYGVIVPPQAKEWMNDNVHRWTEMYGRVHLIGTDTLVVRATGVQGGRGSTHLTVTDTNYQRKSEFRFRGLGGEYYLTDVRVVTTPAAVNGGRPAPITRQR